MVDSTGGADDRVVTDETHDKENGMEATTPETGTSRPARPPLRRSVRDRKVAGVAGGLAEHLNIDPLIVRIAFVASVFAGGVGVLLYLAGWVLIPEEGDQGHNLSFLDRARRVPWLAVVLFVFGVSLLLSQLGGWGDGETFWGLLLIGIGYLLFRERAEKPPPSGEGPGEQPPSKEKSDPPPTGGGMPVTATEFERPAESETVPMRDLVRKPREKSQLGRYTFAAMLIVVGGAALLDYAGAFTLEVGQYPALALTVVGVGLLAGTLWGRSRALILLGLLLVPFAWAGTLVDVPLEGGFGERVYSPAAIGGLQDDYRLVAGPMRFDLTDMQWRNEPVEIDATVAFGVIEVVVPEGVRVELEGSVGAGAIDFFDDNRTGYDIELDDAGGDLEATRTLVLNVRTSVGALDIDDDASGFPRRSQ
jgi:phage shock protein PspC (stress-responsive transcriptional regulator)